MINVIQTATLGSVREVEWKRADGTVELRSTWDFDWQDEIVAEWRRLGDNDSF